MNLHIYVSIHRYGKCAAVHCNDTWITPVDMYRYIMAPETCIDTWQHQSMYRYILCVLSMYRYIDESANHVSIHYNICHVSIHARCRVHTMYVSIHNTQMYIVSIHTRPWHVCMYRYIVCDTLRLTMYRYTFWNLQMKPQCRTLTPVREAIIRDGEERKGRTSGRRLGLADI